MSGKNAAIPNEAYSSGRTSFVKNKTPVETRNAYQLMNRITQRRNASIATHRNANRLMKYMNSQKEPTRTHATPYKNNSISVANRHKTQKMLKTATNKMRNLRRSRAKANKVQQAYMKNYGKPPYQITGNTNIMPLINRNIEMAGLSRVYSKRAQNNATKRYHQFMTNLNTVKEEK